MEGGDQNLGNGIGGSRWNPTKEQINMLESLYRQGLRTPSAEQIQQITARLRDFGHIEGKNVFYWFQNHKARQRQKQKQESYAFYNRFLHATTPVFPPYQNVVCSPCYSPPPRNDSVFYQQHPKVPLPTASGSLKRSRLITQSIDSSKQQQQQPTIQRYNTDMHCIYTARSSSSHHQETLDLFPIHPTGILESSRNDEADQDDHDDRNEFKNPSFYACNPSRLAISAEKERGSNNDGLPLFDFFGDN